MRQTLRSPSFAKVENWQPGDLGVFRGVAECVAEEARTRGFASLTLVSFAFLRAIMRQRK
jgi:hypothetical protein